MRYLGNKTKLTDFIYENTPALPSLETNRFFDLFAGTASVGRKYKREGWFVESSDIMYFSYVLQKAYIKNTGIPSFAKLGGYDKALDYLNNCQFRKGYVWENYTEEGTKGLPKPRKFFSPENGQRIDAIRQGIENLYESKDVSKNEYYVLLATLLENMSLYSNVSGVYAAFLKNYDPRALKALTLKPLELETQGLSGEAYHADGMLLLDAINTDILYLDPPYNSRQYAPNYHVLETVALYDSPVAHGVAGIRNYSELKSDFCNHDKALVALGQIIEKATYKHILMSYNSEGIMHSDEILSLYKKHGTVTLIEKPYRRFKSNNHGDSATKKQVAEHLYVFSPK